MEDPGGSTRPTKTWVLTQQGEALLAAPSAEAIEAALAEHTPTETEATTALLYLAYMLDFYSTGVLDRSFYDIGLQKEVMALASKYPSYFRTAATSEVSQIRAPLITLDTEFECAQDCTPDTQSIAVDIAASAGGVFLSVFGLKVAPVIKNSEDMFKLMTQLKTKLGPAVLTEVMMAASSLIKRVRTLDSASTATGIGVGALDVMKHLMSEAPLELKAMLDGIGLGAGLLGLGATVAGLGTAATVLAVIGAVAAAGVLAVTIYEGATLRSRCLGYQKGKCRCPKDEFVMVDGKCGVFGCRVPSDCVPGQVCVELPPRKSKPPANSPGFCANLKCSGWYDCQDGHACISGICQAPSTGDHACGVVMCTAAESCLDEVACVVAPPANLCGNGTVESAEGEKCDPQHVDGCPLSPQDCVDGPNADDCFPRYLVGDAATCTAECVVKPMPCPDETVCKKGVCEDVDACGGCPTGMACIDDSCTPSGCKPYLFTRADGVEFQVGNPNSVTSPAGHTVALAGLYTATNPLCGWLSTADETAWMDLESDGDGTGVGDYFNGSAVPLEWAIEVDDACKPVWSSATNAQGTNPRHQVKFFYQTHYAGGPLKDGEGLGTDATRYAIRVSEGLGYIVLNNTCEYH